MSLNSSNTMYNSLTPSCQYCGSHALGSCPHCSQQQSFQSYSPQRAMSQRMPSNSRSAVQPSQAERPRQHQFQYDHQAPPTMNPGFNTTFPVLWSLSNEPSARFYWQPSTASEGGYYLDEGQALPDTSFGHLPNPSYDLVPAGDVPYNGPSRPGFTNTYNSLSRSNPAQEVNQAINQGFPQSLPIHSHSTNVAPVSYGTVPNLSIAPVASQQQSEPPLPQSPPVPDLNHQIAADPQHLVPPSVDHWLSDAEEYKPGLSPSRAKPAQLATDHETNDASTASNQHTCRFCQKGFTTNNNLKSHLRTHKDRPYVCTHRTCDARFQYPKDLRRHLLIHRNENSRAVPKYLCPEPNCEYNNKGFARKDHFKRHLTTHYSEFKAKELPNNLKQFIDQCHVDFQRRQRSINPVQQSVACSSNPLYDVRQLLQGANETSAAPIHHQTAWTPSAPLTSLQTNIAPRTARSSVLGPAAYPPGSSRCRSRRGSSTQQ